MFLHGALKRDQMLHAPVFWRLMHVYYEYLLQVHYTDSSALFKLKAFYTT